MAAGCSRSPTARRVWIWLDASDPREAAALAAYDRIQSTMPRRVRSALLRDLLIRGLAEIERAMDGAGDTADLMPAPATAGRKRGRSKKERPAAAVTARRIGGGRQHQAANTTVGAPADAPNRSEEAANDGGGEPPGLMW